MVQGGTLNHMLNYFRLLVFQIEIIPMSNS